MTLQERNPGTPSDDPSFYRCPTGKRIYYEQRHANRAINKAAERGEIGPMRHYECPECGHWHLATKRGPA